MYMKPAGRMLITAGPTHEPIDAVRYIANQSSGRMGLALAAAARELGWSVTLLLGPTSLVPPNDFAVHRFETTDELEKLLEEHFPACDVLIMAAAVADYRPQRFERGKLPRGQQALHLKLEPTPDLVAKCASKKRDDQFIVGFALEEASQLEMRAKEKLRTKRLDAIVANSLDTLGAKDIVATIFAADGKRISWGSSSMSKDFFASRLLEWLQDEIPQCR